MDQNQRKDQFAKAVKRVEQLVSEEYKRTNNLQGHLNAAQDKIFTLKADNERLRNTLEKIVPALKDPKDYNFAVVLKNAETALKS